ncbi:MAG: hypothetical protein LAP86_29490 [Acidobacteriia bacterium]|nr:hypothetical protein [Terriglobia bacterium]
MKAQEIIHEVEAAGGILFLDGEGICYELPPTAVTLLPDLRAHREEIVNALRSRESLPDMPAGIRLAAWKPKRSPVVLTRFSVVIDTYSFINRTLAELEAVATSTNRSISHVRELIERLEQVGVRVELDEGGCRKH